MYIYERKGWPNFQWDQLKIAEHLAPIRYRAGRLIGKMESLGFSLQSEAVLQTMIVEALKTSEIEGEFLDKEQVRSSIARQLGMDVSGLIASDRNVDGLVEILIDATKNYKSRLTKERLFSWHAALFPTGRNGLKKYVSGNGVQTTKNQCRLYPVRLAVRKYILKHLSQKMSRKKCSFF